ncbi:MAG: hypothetical protein Q7R70_04675 [Candidatus Diapherotrites archaeon]|nr:hypothetical protein [Candidatus Diapherotrites archaeon]
MRKEILLLAGLAALALLNGCVSKEFDFGTGVLNFKTCSDGTPYKMCSFNSPYYCKDGNLVKDKKKCAETVEIDYNFDQNFVKTDYNFEPPKKCTDGTLYDFCSASKPLYCKDGNLANNASVCGCSEGKRASGNDCGPKQAINGEFEYYFKGKSETIKLELDGGLNDYLKKIPREYYCTPECPSRTELELRLLNESRQKPELEKLAKAIMEKTSNKDEQARIAINLVQKIPYDWNAFYDQNDQEKYPYEVLFKNAGICGEKSKLLAFLLREFGFGTALFHFEKENHMAVGIKCPISYSFKNSGYCFIETTKAAIITDSDANYLSVGKLVSEPKVYKLNEGNSFNSVDEEVNDLALFKKLERNNFDGNSYNQWLALNYKPWLALINKYGMVEKSCDSNKSFCNGECFPNCGQNQVFNCSESIGGFCKFDPKNCPEGRISCNEECWPKCTEGTFKCETYGGVCEIAAYG